jgi:tetratricopeptide (TPR) repeat protein
VAIASDVPGANSVRFQATAALCLALLLAAYSNFFKNAFQFDDSHIVENNLFIRSLANVPGFFTDARTYTALKQNQAYRPLVATTLAVDYRLAGGLSPTVFHASQLFQLALLGVAIWFFFRRVLDFEGPRAESPYLALFGATLFSVHTLNTETMNLMHVRSEILSALGIVGAFLVYLGAPRLRRMHLYLVPMVIGALAKTPAVVFGPLLFAWEFLRFRDDEPEGRHGGRFRQALAASWPSLVAGIVVFWFVEGFMASPSIDYGGRERLPYALTQVWLWLHYLRLFALPVGLTADTDLVLIRAWNDTRVVAGALAILGLAVTGWRCARRRDTWPVAFGLAWFGIGLLPASSVIPLAEPTNDHRPFLAFIGLTLALLAAVRLLRPRTAHRPAVIVAILIAMAVLAGNAWGTWVRNRAWRTHESLWEDVTKKSPANGRAWMNYGAALMARGELVRASECYERAALLTPNYWMLEINRGIVKGSLGDARAAEKHFLRAIDLKPGEPDSHFFFARWLSGVGRGPEAVQHLETALRLSPGAANVRSALLDLRAASGDAAGTAALARGILEVEPGDARARALADGRNPYRVPGASADTLLKTGMTLGTKREFAHSAEVYRAVLEIEPDNADALNNLGWTLGELGFFAQAVPVLEKAVALRPDFALARNNLAWARGRMTPQASVPR